MRRSQNNEFSKYLADYRLNAFGIALRRPHHDWIFEMLLETSELPDIGLKCVNEKLFKAGAGQRSTIEIRKARREGRVTAWRCYRSDSPLRSIWIQVTPFKSANEASDRVPLTLETLIHKPRSGLTVTGSGLVEGVMAARLSDFLVFEQRATGAQGEGADRLVAGNIENILLVMDFGAGNDLWTWEIVTSIVELQVEKIKSGISDRQST